LDYCERNCLTQPASTFLNQCPLICASETVEHKPEPELDPLTMEEVDLFAVEILEQLKSLKDNIPEHHWDELDMFNGEKAALTLPEIRRPDIDFAIDLDPSKPLPKPSRPYHMNQEECAECQKVLNQMLNAGWAEPANMNCLLAMPMFFVWKKDGTQ
jgi:hypothetical protein